MQIKTGASSISVFYCCAIRTPAQCMSLLNGRCTFLIQHNRHTKKKTDLFYCIQLQANLSTFLCRKKYIIFQWQCLLFVHQRVMFTRHETGSRRAARQPVSYIQASSSFALQIFTHYHKQHRCKAVTQANINSDKCFLQGGFSVHDRLVNPASITALAPAF